VAARLIINHWREGGIVIHARKEEALYDSARCGMIAAFGARRRGMGRNGRANGGMGEGESLHAALGAQGPRVEERGEKEDVW
jgi:hypothetical protein